MKFTTPCFIRKNKPELIKKLEDLGYVNRNLNEYRGNSICTLVNYNLTDIITATEYICFSIDDDFLEVIAPSFGAIDCGENEDLFLSLAALRKDSDINQWFVYNTRDCMVEELRMYEFIFCDEERIEDMLSYNCEFINAHKATPEELIEHFK